MTKYLSTQILYRTIIRKLIHNKRIKIDKEKNKQEFSLEFI